LGGDYAGRNDRPGQRAASHFVDAADQPKAFRAGRLLESV
jgi:hypothetical protein